MILSGCFGIDAGYDSEEVVGIIASGSLQGWNQTCRRRQHLINNDLDIVTLNLIWSRLDPEQIRFETVCRFKT